MDTSARDCLVLFDTRVEARLDEGWQSGVLRQRTRTVKAGPMVYMDCYPVWDTQTARAARTEAGRERHRRAQEALNRRNARRRLEQLVNANFAEGDLMLTCEYAHGREPGSDDQAARDIRNMIKRLRRRRARHTAAPMRYIYVTEVTVSARYGTRWHHHLILSGDGLTRGEAEDCWRKIHGGLCNARIAQPTERHLSGFARYLTQDKRTRTMEQDGRNPQARAMRRSWCASTGLIKPEDRATVADRKISIRKAGRIAETVADFDRAKAIFARLYPDCALLEIEAQRSRFTAGVYIRAVLRRAQNMRSRCASGRTASRH